MLLLGLLLLAAPEDLPTRLRHLESAGSAEAPASSPEGSRIASHASTTCTPSPSGSTGRYGLAPLASTTTS